MPITSTGYDASVTETVWGSTAGLYGSAEPGVAGAADCAVTVTGAGVTVAAGTAYGWGVIDAVTGTTALTFQAPSSGFRYDAVVIRRDWGLNSTSLAVVQGGSVRAVPALRVQPGVLAEQALALVQVTAGSPPVLSDDLRVSYAPTGLARSVAGMTGPIGSRYILEGSGRRYAVMAGGPAPEWEPAGQQMPAVPVIRSGTASVVTNSTGAVAIPHGLGYAPSLAFVSCRAGEASPQVQVAVSSAPGAVNASSMTIVAKVKTAAGSAPYVGALSNVDWVTHAWTSPPIAIPDEPATTPTDPDKPVTSGGGSDTVGQDTDAAPAPQTPLPQTPPIYVVPTPTVSSVQSILSTAAAEIGTRESPAGSNNVKYWLAEKPTWNGQPWCACFASWVYRRNGINVVSVLAPTGSNPYYCPYLEAAAKAKGLWYTGTPRPGDMVLYGAAEAVHVEIVEQWIASTGRVQTIGGNTSDGLNGSPNNGGGVYRNIRNPSSASLPIRGYIRMPTSVPTTLQVRGPFPLSTGHYFGVADASTTLDHNGVADNAQGVMQIQAEVGATVDGVYGASTETLVRKWQAAMFRTQTGRVTAEDWGVFNGTFTAPQPPTGVVATAGNSSATVVFNASNGAQQYTARASTGQTVTGTASPLTITGLTPGVGVQCTVAAANVAGASAQSARSATVYPVEGGLSTVMLTDGSVIPVWAGSSRFPAALVGSVVTNIGSQAVYDAFVAKFPAARFTAGAQQMARNVCTILYGSAYPAPANRASVRFAFSGGDLLAQTDTAAGTVTFGTQSVGASTTSSYVTHEFVHLFQVFSPIYGSNATVTAVIEGIADYVLVQLGYHTVAAQRPAGGGAKWDGSYDTTAFFFDYVANRAPTKTPDFVMKLNQQMGSSSWTPAQITSINAAGKTVDQLWSDYKTWVATQ